jgi:uncharacterized protein GlcG (DUF336 family)
MLNEIHEHVCVGKESRPEVKCVERSDDANFAKSKISQQRAMTALLPGWEHAKTPLKHVERGRVQTNNRAGILPAAF